jgi:hypothetical protein
MHDADAGVHVARRLQATLRRGAPQWSPHCVHVARVPSRCMYANQWGRQLLCYDHGRSSWAVAMSRGATLSFLFCFFGGPRTPERVHEIFWFIVHGVRETFVDRCITVVAEGSRLTWAMGGKKRSEILCMPSVLGSITSPPIRTICAVDLVMRASLHPCQLPQS